jgi:aspartate aminotransferase-like enzyme
MLRREMPNGDPPLTSSDVLHYALDEGLNMRFEEGLESARRRKGPKAMGLQPLPQTPHAPAPTASAFTAPAGLETSDAR